MLKHASRTSYFHCQRPPWCIKDQNNNRPFGSALSCYLSLESRKVEITYISLSKANYQNTKNNSSNSYLQKAYLYAWHHTRCFTMLFHLVLVTGFWNWFYSPHFTEQETKVREMKYFVQNNPTSKGLGLKSVNLLKISFNTLEKSIIQIINYLKLMKIFSHTNHELFRNIINKT